MSGYTLTMRIEICGIIASGKTTLASILAANGYQPVLEKFQQNPFWAAFFEDQAKFAFETEITFLLLHYHQLKAEAEQNCVCDYSFTQDSAYADLDLEDSKRKAFTIVQEEIEQELGKPELIIHLTCAPEIAVQRLRARGRSEENKISLDFLENLNNAISRRLAEVAQVVKILVINSSEVDFAKSANDQDAVKSLVQAQLQRWLSILSEKCRFQKFGLFTKDFDEQ